MSMGFFLMIVAVLFAILFGLALCMAGFLFEGRRLQIARLLLLGLDGAILSGLFLGPRLFRDAPWATGAIEFLSMVVMAQFFLVATTLLAVGVRALWRICRREVPFDRNRRRLLKHAILYPAVSIAAGVYGGAWERNHTVVRHYDIPVPDLPENLQGFTIAQVSDVHLGRFFSLERLKDLLAQAAGEAPDLLAITGDIFDDAEMTAEAASIVDSFADGFPQGIWYCHGNHEHHRGIAWVNRCLEGTRIHALVNRWEIAVPGERPLTLAGVDYPMHFDDEMFQQKKHEFTEEAMEGMPKGAIPILLAHHPEFIDNAREHSIPLTLTGHTHGSQVGIFGIPLFPVFKYTRGMVKENGCYGYVHVGNGSWFPYRFGCPPEIACFRLVKA